MGNKVSNAPNYKQPAKSTLSKSFYATFIEDELENLYLKYEWLNSRRAYSIIGLILFIFTIIQSTIFASLSYKPLDSYILGSLIAFLLAIELLMVRLNIKERQPDYLNLLVSVSVITLSINYIVLLDFLPVENYETLVSLCFIISPGVIFLSNGRFSLILFNLAILNLPINIVTVYQYGQSPSWITASAFIGVITFLIYFDSNTRRLARLNWYRQYALDSLNDEMTEIIANTLESKSRIEEAAQENIHLMEEVFQAKEEAEKRNQFLNGLIEGLPQGIAVLDAKASIITHNNKILELLNLDQNDDDSYKGKTLKDVIDALREMQGHHSPRFWASYDEIIPKKLNPIEGQKPPLIKSDFKMDDGTFLSFTEFPLSGGENILITQDITYRKEIETAMRRQALTDSLTGLANRHAFDLKFDDAIKRSHRNNTSLGLAMIDLDKFKPINDTYGHPVGDKILQYVGQALRDQVRSTDLPCRLGGDEFAVLFTDISPERPPTNACNRILEALNKMIEIDGLELKLGASIGLTFSNSPEIKPDQLIDEADKALYRAKDEGRGILEVVQTDIC